MKVIQMPPVHAANLVANSGNTAYGVDVIGYPIYVYPIIQVHEDLGYASFQPAFTSFEL